MILHLVPLAVLGAESAVADEAEPKICECIGDKCGSGVFLPLFSGEHSWNDGLRAVLYFLGLIWCFMGVAIVSDVFMSAIETITSKERKIKVKVAETGDERVFRVRVWNDTVANLTLMALGSSAPEILLSVIELISNNFYSGALGPSTIVGSAAFNMLVITAVCVMAIPDGEVRYISGTKVFAVTAFFSVFAYGWLLIILVVITPDKVDIVEGCITFGFFPLLVSLSYAMDKDLLFTKTRAMFDKIVAAQECDNDDGVSPRLVRKVTSEVARKGTISQDVLNALLNSHKQNGNQPKSRARYRIEATRSLFMKSKLPSRQTPVSQAPTTVDAVEPIRTCQIMFAPTTYSVLENAGTVELTVKRTDATATCSVQYATKDGTADKDDYKPKTGELNFQPGETTKTITIEIIDDNQWEQDETFYVILSNPQSGDDMTSLAPQCVATVTIVNDDVPGYLTFVKDEFHSLSKDGEAKIVVQRRSGCSGVVGAKWTTKDAQGAKAATAGEDYQETSGTVEFKHEELEKEIVVKLMPKPEANSFFMVELSDPYGGATLDKTTDGGDTKCICEVIIDYDTKSMAKTQTSLFGLDMESQWIAASTYKEQITMAILVNGSWEGQEEAGVGDVICHIIALPWKLLFATIPPPDFLGGWLCFVFSLIYIGFVTAIVGDMAASLGCVLSMPDEITAITLVALGTSLPDTFASKTAAVQDPHADNSIGNVTGSNSVNVFLGLGLPWTIGSIYWSMNFDSLRQDWEGHDAGGKMFGVSEALGGMGYLESYPDGGFMVPAGNLGFSVGVFTTCALLCIAGLVVRRKLFGGELGGPRGPKVVSAVFFVCLWFTYIGCASAMILSSD
uniref:Calx-beta domain-containing protein n=1 Tax=Oxyrrhis marina TaxID=2969 RepID=A0A7S4LQM0_OXYMA|mmetsp:Transcript_36067/g.94410  ORF Transcript_36067/g.94410 Transcript_36067/m.94410 type:complete len:848 (+) Transcript_36067:101-2644(+)